MSQRREFEDKNMVNIASTIEFLNSLVELDQEAMQSLFDTRISCNQLIIDHPTVQTSNGHVGLLGIINGLFGTDDRGWGHICAMFDLNNRLIGFCAVDRGAEKNKAAQEIKAAESHLAHEAGADCGLDNQKCTFTICEKCGKPYSSDVGHVSGREICEKCGPRYLSRLQSQLAAHEQRHK